MAFVQTLWNTAYGQCSELFKMALMKKDSDLGIWNKCRDNKDLLQLLNLIDMVCDDGSSSTNKDKTYICISQAQKFHNFTHWPNDSATKFVH